MTTQEQMLNRLATDFLQRTEAWMKEDQWALALDTLRVVETCLDALSTRCYLDARVEAILDAERAHWDKTRELGARRS